MIPMESVLGRLSLFPVGNTGTIPFESTASNPAEHEALAEFTTPVLSVIRHRAPCSGDCCRLWHLDVFAFTWSSDL